MMNVGGALRSLALLSFLVFYGLLSPAKTDIWLEGYKDKKLVNLSNITKDRTLLLVAQEHCAPCDEQVETLIKTPPTYFSAKVIWISETEKPRKSWVGKIPIFSGDRRHLQELGKTPIVGTPTHLVYCKGTLQRQETGSASVAVLNSWFQIAECKSKGGDDGE